MAHPQEYLFGQSLEAGEGKEKDSSPEIPKGMSPAHVLTLSPCKPFWISDLQHQDIPNLCCFKPLILWLWQQ